jgi:hypothetical protein
VSEHPVHPAVAPVIAALDALTDYQPTSDADLADVLISVHNADGANVIGWLAVALGVLGRKSTNKQVYYHLNDAADRLSGVGCDWIDLAREATGHWNGTVGTDADL